ncbi:MAG: hypothetical protein HWE20_01350 [Gammaproteobacteria bacterium]|nr:hypothetical protein [Gammaproteobacteria bacterium]
MRRFNQAALAGLIAGLSLSTVNAETKGYTVVPNLGLNAFGIDVSREFRENTSLRASLSGFKSSVDETEDGFDAEADVTLLNLGGFVDYRPNPNSGFFISGGLIYTGTGATISSKVLSEKAGTTITNDPATNTTTATLTDNTEIKIQGSGNTGSTNTITVGEESFEVENGETYVYQIGGKTKVATIFDGNIVSYNVPDDETTAQVEAKINTDIQNGDILNSNPANDKTVIDSQTIVEDITGDLTIDAEVNFKNPIAPYIGAGYQRNFGQDALWVFSANAGIMITGGMEYDLRVNCDSDADICVILDEEIQSTTNDTRADIDDALDDVPNFWPVVSVGIGRKF